MITLDGNYLEGGGALVRVALALSALTGKEFRVSGIRAGRKEGGLKAQHLEAVKALKKICQAETNEIKIGSTELWFKPKGLSAGSSEIDIGTAGSITLLLQGLLLPCLFAPGKVTLKIKGGTCGRWQASVDYLKHILLPHLQRFAEKLELKIIKRGYYPKGGGEVILEIVPKLKLDDFDNFSLFQKELMQKTTKIKLVQPGKLEQIEGVVNVSAELKAKEVGGRIKKAAENYLNSYHVPLNLEVEYVPSLSPGGEAVLWALFRGPDQANPVILGADALVEKGKSSEEVGKETAEKLIKEINSGAAVDRHLADQLIPFMALLPGSEIKASEVSRHALTNIYVARQFLPVKFVVEGNKIRVETAQKDL